MKKLSLLLLGPPALLILVFAGRVLAAPILPDFGLATFAPGTPVDHRYFPLLSSTPRIFVGEKEEDGEIVTEGFEFTNLGSGPTILGVQTTTRRDRAFEDGVLIEDTFDYYAQDTGGNVWYFGEDVTNFIYDDDGNLIDTNSSSSWRAGENFADPSGDPALPGFIMPALTDALTNGFSYYQEFAPDDEALDQAEHVLPLVSVSLDIGNFTDVLRVFETNPLEPDAREYKYYAPGIGLILVEEGLDENRENPDIRVALVSAVPEPSTLALMLIGLAGLLGRGRLLSH